MARAFPRARVSRATGPLLFHPELRPRNSGAAETPSGIRPPRSGNVHVVRSARAGPRDTDRGCNCTRVALGKGRACVSWSVALKLGRVSNLPTVWTNVLVGVVVVGGAAVDARVLLLLLALSL